MAEPTYVVKKEFDMFTISIQDKLEIVAQEVAGLIKRHDNLEKILEAVQRESSHNNIQIASIFEQLTDLYGLFRSLDERVTTIESRLEKVEGRLENIEGRLFNLETRLENLEIRLEKVEGRLVNLERSFKKMSAKLTEHDGMFAKMNEKLDRIIAHLGIAA